MSQTPSSYLMTLPTKWLESSWIEHVSSVRYEQQGVNVMYNTDVIDKPDLFLWIRRHHFPQASPKDFRRALRQMCSDQRPGYKASPLNPELRKTLGDRIAAVGKRLWSCQVADLMIEARKPSITASLPASTSPELPPTIEDVNEIKRRKILTSNSRDESPSHVSNGPDNEPHSTYGLATTLLGLAQPQRSPIGGQSSMNAASSAMEGRMVDSVSMGQHSITAKDGMLRTSSDEFGLGLTNGFKANSNGKEQQQNISSRPPTFDTIESLLPPMMTQQHLVEFNTMTSLLEQFHMNHVAPKHFKALEHNFTQYFSRPSCVSFVIMKTDRFTTGQPDIYANQQAEQLFSVGLTKALHVFMGIDSTRRAIGCLTQSAQMNLMVAHVPGVWASTRDAHLNPCPRLVDMWLPRILFNGNCFMVIVAPHGTVSLERAFEVFHTPSDPLFINV